MPFFEHSPWSMTSFIKTFPVSFPERISRIFLYGGDIPEYFYECAVFCLAPRLVNIQARSENIKQCYTPISYIWSNCFFFCQVFPLISNKAGKAKWIEKRSVRSRPVKQVFFTAQNNQLYTCAIYIYSSYLNSTLCSWIINQIILSYPSPTQHHSFLRN